MSKSNLLLQRAGLVAGIAGKPLGRFRGLLLLVLAATSLGQCGGSTGGNQNATHDTTGTSPPTALAPDTIARFSNGLVEPSPLNVSRGRRHKVRWDNSDRIGYTIKFTMQGWPFEDPPQDIHVPAHGKSNVFTVLDTTPKGPYAYKVFKPGLYPPGQGPPNPPEVNVGD